MANQRNSPPEVSVEQFRQSIRLRWRYNKERYSITVGTYSVEFLEAAHGVKKIIEQDILKGKFDTSKSKYEKLLKKKTAKPDPLPAKTKVQKDLKPSGTTNESLPQVKRTSHGKRIVNPLPPETKVSLLFSDWIKKAGLNPVPYNVEIVRKVLIRFGEISLYKVPEYLSNKNFASVTHNCYLNILRRFYKWLLRKKYLKHNPFEEVQNKRKSGANRKTFRQPFSDDEIKAILHAFKTDQFAFSKSFPHSVYYPLVYFIFSTGTRTGEAVGVKIQKINFKSKYVTIDKSLSPTAKGSSVSARVYKDTKTGNSRNIPLTDEMLTILLKICEGREPDQYVFLTRLGNPIDPRMFQKRVFKRVLEKLSIPERDLLASRHTFGTVVIEQKIDLLEGAYLMGHSNPKTLLENYAHRRKIPKEVPKIIPD